MENLTSIKNKKSPTETHQSWMKRLLSWELSNMSEPSPLRRYPAGFSGFLLLQVIAYGTLNLFKRAFCFKPWLFWLLLGLCAGIVLFSISVLF